ncbi:MULTISPECIES: hypothetical protein [Pseudomonas]|uniref:hypothetical protein n=1 Tax=Pseudomonas TaxID=286 RepID=UPI001B3321B4|nr:MULTISPECIES: hypothetical protein [Pseudomonas]
METDHATVKTPLDQTLHLTVTPKKTTSFAWIDEAQLLGYASVKELIEVRFKATESLATIASHIISGNALQQHVRRPRRINNKRSLQPAAQDTAFFLEFRLVDSREEVAVTRCSVTVRDVVSK